jgi:hypothetical protein
MSTAIPTPRRASLLRLAIGALALLLVLARFLPTKHVLAGAVQDEGWVWGLKVAAAHGLVFGRDLIFTYGPFGPLETRLFDPSMRGLIAGGGALMGVAFATGLLAIARPAMLIVTALLLSLVQTDALVYALPLPAMLLCARLRPDRPLSRSTLAAVLTLLPALALLPLIKGSFLAASLLSVALLTTLLWRSRHKQLALALPVLTALCLALLWRAAGQPLAALPDYFSNQLSIIIGYNDAMAVHGPRADTLIAVSFCISLLAALAWGARALPRAVSLPLGACVGALLFLAFKAGFSRQDPGHETITISALGLMFLLLSNWLPRIEAGAAALVGVALLVWPVAGLSPLGAASAALQSLSAELRGTVRLAVDPAGLEADFAASVPVVPALPWRPPGTADIYSSGQLRLFATGLTWAPRPVLQSYAAYTPRLARLNLDHLIGAAAPENIFFRPEPIDFRLPSLEDGLSWPALLSLYDPASYDAALDLAWLRRADHPAKLAEPGPPLLVSEPRLGETVTLPATPMALWARIDVRPTIAGRLAGLLLRTPFLDIRLDFADGRSEEFRFIPGMASPGFLISPFVTTALDFLRLRHLPGSPAVPLRRPVAISLAPRKRSAAWAWQTLYHLSVAPIAFPPLSAMWKVHGTVVPQQTTLPAAPPGNCFIDDVDGFAVPPAPLEARWPIWLNGWAVFDAAAAISPDKTDIGFQDPLGRVFSVPTRPVPRTDVASVFHLRDSDHVGFATEADLSSLPPGPYRVLALPRHGEAVRACRTSLVVTVPASP